MGTKTKRILSGLTLIIMLMITGLASISYAEESQTTDELYLGLTLWRDNDTNDFYSTINNKDDTNEKADKLSELKNDRTIVNPTMKVRDWSKTVLDTYKSDTSSKTRYGLEGYLKNHILNQIGDMPIKNVSNLFPVLFI